jgi:hypothetical protein
MVKGERINEPACSVDPLFLKKVSNHKVNKTFGFIFPHFYHPK